LDLVDLAGAIRDLDPDDPEFRARLEAFGVTHVYLGQRQGEVNSKRVRLQVGPFLDSAHYELVYHVDRVWIFAYLGD
jgi:hypothetical protein